ncbi:hypothetical protein [Actinomadura sp. 6N118]|uniref:hypothetical protein n=1 Tax=Actinomadura sp. 6N118 TaxID=3375151 RepID=UPI00378E2C09
MKPASKRAPRLRRTLTTVTAVGLIAAGCLLAPVAVIAAWAHQLSDTGRYVQTVAPLASHPSVQNAVADRLAAAAMAQIDVPALLDRTAKDLPGPLADGTDAIAGPLAERLHDLIHDTATDVVADPRFRTFWTEANQALHSQVTAVLSGRGSTVLTVQRDSIALNLGPLLDQVKQRLTEAGLTAAGALPHTDLRIHLLTTSDLITAQRGYQALHAWWWLPAVVSPVLTAIGIRAATRRGRALTASALGLTTAMLALQAALLAGRSSLLHDRVLDTAADTEIVEALTVFPHTALRGVAVVGVLVAAGSLAASRIGNLRDRRDGDERPKRSNPTNSPDMAHHSPGKFRCP